MSSEPYRLAACVAEAFLLPYPLPNTEDECISQRASGPKISRRSTGEAGRGGEFVLCVSNVRGREWTFVPIPTEPGLLIFVPLCQLELGVGVGGCVYGRALLGCCSRRSVEHKGFVAYRRLCPRDS